MIQKPRNGESGFTLIELIVILAIMGILAAVVGVGVVLIKPKRADIPFGGLRTTQIDTLAPLCDTTELEQLERLPPEGRKALEPTYKERLQKDLEKVEALEAGLEGLKTEKAVLQEQPGSTENRDKHRVLQDKIFLAERDLETYRSLFDVDMECLLRIAADTASPVPAPSAPVPRPLSPVSHPIAPAPAPPASTRTPAFAVPSSPTPVGVEPPHRGPPDWG